MEQDGRYTRPDAPATRAATIENPATDRASTPGDADTNRTAAAGALRLVLHAGALQVGRVAVEGDGPCALSVLENFAARLDRANARAAGVVRPRAIPEPRSESAGVEKAHSLAPSHNPNRPGSRSEGQGAARGAPPQGSEASRGGDGGALTVASTPAPCDVTGRVRSGPGPASVTDRAVTPVRYAGHNADTCTDEGGDGGAPEAPPPAGGPRVLRCALDWFTVLCLVPVTRARWGELRELAVHKVAVLVPSLSGVVPVELCTLGKDIVGKSTAGVRFLLREPESCSVRDVPSCTRSETTWRAWAMAPDPAPGVQCHNDARQVPEVPPELVELRALDDGGPVAAGPPWRCSSDRETTVAAGLERRPGDDVRAVYGVELQIQGVAFSSVKTGGDELVRDLWRALTAWLFAGRWIDPAAVLDPFTRAGRFDVATDVAFTNDPGGEWVTWGIYADGSHSDCFRRFSSRARKVQSEETVRAGDDAAAASGEVPISGRRALLGKVTAGRTLYLGSAAYVLLCVYERSKKRDGDWGVLGPTLLQCGWDGESEVVRTEFRGSRKWLGDQVLRAPDGAPMFPRRVQSPGESDGLSAAELTLSEFLRALPSLVAEFPSRFRHTDPAQDDGHGPRVRDRRSSAWWSGVEGAALHWSSGGGDLGRVVSTRRHAAADRTVRQLRTGLVRLVALRGGRDLSDVLPEVFGAWHDPEFAEERPLLIERQRARYAIPPPQAVRVVVPIAATG